MARNNIYCYTCINVLCNCKSLSHNIITKNFFFFPCFYSRNSNGYLVKNHLWYNDILCKVVVLKCLKMWIFALRKHWDILYIRVTPPPQTEVIVGSDSVSSMWESQNIWTNNGFQYWISVVCFSTKNLRNCDQCRYAI